MFSLQHRLRREQDILRVVKSKRGVFDAACGVKYAKNDQGVARFAIVVGTKVHKSAVQRNRVRRQYREIVRSHLGRIVPGNDLVLLTAKPALDLSYAEKEARLLRILRKGGLLVESAPPAARGDATDSRVPKNTVI